MKTSIRATVLASAMGIPALVALASSSSAHADFSVCNDTSTKVYVAYAYIDKVDGFISRGWRTLNPNGDCRTVVSTSQTSDPSGYFYYAKAADGSGVWEHKHPGILLHASRPVQDREGRRPPLRGPTTRPPAGSRNQEIHCYAPPWWRSGGRNAGEWVVGSTGSFS